MVGRALPSPWPHWRQLSRWFDTGLLSLQRLDWHATPAALLGRLIELERVHTFGGWGDLRARLAGPAGGAEPLQPCFRKTFTERPSWVAAAYAFRRVITLNGVAVHFMLCVAFALQLCAHDAATQVPDFTMEEARAEAERACLARRFSRRRPGASAGSPRGG